jgi:hypothetical protein
MIPPRLWQKLAGWSAALAALLFVLIWPSEGTAQAMDPRVGLRAGWLDAESASLNLELRAHRSRPEGFFNPVSPGDGDFSNTDLAFRDSYVFVGNYHGFNVYDISDPRNPVLRVSVVCPGGQGDLSIFGNLLFMSVQETRGRLDCGTQGTGGEVDPARFRGVRIFDVSEIERPRQVAAVQTCRGSHTHTLVTDPHDPDHLYVYNSGTSASRSGAELEGCSDVRDPQDPTTAYWSIDVIQVPLAAPERARVVRSPRVFANPETGAIAGLWAGGDHGEGTQTTRETNQCHDLTVYPDLGRAAGACSGNGILFDISNPAVPIRLHEVVDPSFAYWHSATFNNDGTTVLFTDEWGGGSAPRCLASDPPEWGANAIFEVVNGRMEFRSYYKLPAPQTETENCVAHNGSLVPVPGRDIKVQAWYQGGISVFDFTDPARPYEIAYFDRGPMSDTELMTGGYWSAYWYNGWIYASEIGRGFDVLELLPNAALSENELAAARLVEWTEFNPQMQPRVTWPAHFVVARAYLDQLERGNGLPAETLDFLRRELDRLEESPSGPDRRADLTALAVRLEQGIPGATDPTRVRSLAQSLRLLSTQER